MFEFMYRFRMPILVAIVLGMAGFGVWASLVPAAGGPATEDRVHATYRVPGTEVEGEIRTPRFRETLHYINLTRRLGDRLYGSQFRRLQFETGIAFEEKKMQSFVYGFEVLREIARQTDFQPNPEEVETLARELAKVTAAPEARDREIPPTESLLQFVRDWRRIAMMRRQSVFSPEGVDYGKVLKTYQQQYPEVTAKYVFWRKKDPSEFQLDLTKEEDKAKLKAWFDENPAFRNRAELQEPEQVDVGVVFVRWFKEDRTLEELETKIDRRYAQEFAQIEVSEAEIQRRLEAYQAQTGSRRALPWQWILDLEAEKRAAENPGAEDQPSIEEVLRPHIERELKVARLLAKVWDAAKEDGLEAAAVRYGMEYREVDDLTQRDLMAEHPSLAGGPRLWQMIRGQAIDRLEAEDEARRYEFGELVPMVTSTQDGSYFTERPIYDEPGQMMGIFTLRGYRPARPPEFEDVLSEAYTAWQQAQSDKDFRERGQEFRDAVDAWVKENVEEVATQVAEIEADTQKKIDEEIANRKLDPEREGDAALIEEIEKRHKRDDRGEISQLIDEHVAKAFEPVAQELGYEVGTLGPLVPTGEDGGGVAYSEDIPELERLNRYLRSPMVVSRLKSLEEGRMTSGARRPDLQAELGAHFLIVEKRLPTAEEMFQRPDRYGPIANRHRPRPNFQGWTYEDMKQEHMFALSAPELEEQQAAAERDERAAEERSSSRAERERQRLERILERRRAQERNENQGSPPGDAGEPGASGSGGETPGSGAEEPDRDG